jgi:hypothetical protein
MQNIGKVSNHNLEFEASIRPLVSPALSWNATFTWNENSNKVLSLGDSPPTPSSQYTSSPQNLYVVGYPVDGQWTRTIVNYGDANHNGVLELNEIQLSDSVAYAGHPSPSHHLGWQNNLAFLSGRFSIGANFTYEGGAEQYNELVADQCYAQTCRAAVDPSTPLAEQVLAANVYSAWPYLEHTSVFRLEELSLTLEAPASITRALRSQRATISLMGRNLKFWTHYRGIDPDINTLGFGGDIIRDDGGVAQPRSWTLRVNLGY